MDGRGRLLSFSLPRCVPFDPIYPISTAIPVAQVALHRQVVALYVTGSRVHLVAGSWYWCPPPPGGPCGNGLLSVIKSGPCRDARVSYQSCA